MPKPTSSKPTSPNTKPSHPSASSNPRSNSWRNQLNVLAELTGTQGKAASVIEAADKSVTTVDEKITSPGEKTMLLSIQEEQVRQYLPDSFVGAGAPNASKTSTSSNPPSPPKTLKATQWNQLPAVENGQLCTTENLTSWILTGPAVVEIVTSDLEACFAAS